MLSNPGAPGVTNCIGSLLPAATCTEPVPDEGGEASQRASSEELQGSIAARPQHPEGLEVGGGDPRWQTNMSHGCDAKLLSVLYGSTRPWISGSRWLARARHHAAFGVAAHGSRDNFCRNW